jgi:hypothetical protein
MKLLTSSVLLLSPITTAGAFSPIATPSIAVKRATSASPFKNNLVLSASTTEASPFVQGPRVVREQLPIVYVYDHCPFCVRVRLALGIKNVKHNIHFLQNDDVSTPTKLIGKKIAPIFVSVKCFFLLFIFLCILCFL